MEDIIKSVKAFLYDRSTSPLFGAFVVSWAAWNYRFIIYVISDINIDQKIKLIDSYFSALELELFGCIISIPSQLTNGFIVPAVFASLYIYAYPYLAKPVYRFSLKRQTEIRTIKQQEGDARLLDEKESREILQRLAELQEKYNSDTDNLQRQVSSLSKTITEFENKTKPDLSKVSDKELEEIIYSSPEKNSNKELSETEIGVLSMFPHLEEGHGYPPTEVSKHLKIEVAAAYDVLAKLNKEKYIEYFFETDEKEPAYGLAAKGRKYLAINNLLERGSNESSKWDDAGISKNAYELIKAAASDENGTIMKPKAMGLNSIQAGSQQFGGSGKREYAMYEEALNELLDKNYVKGLGIKDEVFELTHAGWELADKS